MHTSLLIAFLMRRRRTRIPVLVNHWKAVGSSVGGASAVVVVCLVAYLTTWARGNIIPDKFIQPRLLQASTVSPEASMFVLVMKSMIRKGFSPPLYRHLGIAFWFWAGKFWHNHCCKFFVRVNCTVGEDSFSQFFFFLFLHFYVLEGHWFLYPWWLSIFFIGESKKRRSSDCNCVQETRNYRITYCVSFVKLV